MYCEFGILKNYSDIPTEELRADNAIEAMLFLLKNHFVIINANHEIETIKLIKALKNISIKYAMKHIEKENKYEFTLDLFKDDRK